MKQQVHTKALRFLVAAGMLALTTTGFSQTGYFGKFFTHVATAGNQAGNWTNMTHADLDGNASAIAIATQNWSVNNVYNNFNYGLWYTSGSNWAVYNENTSDTIPVGSAYNVLIPTANGTAFTHTSDTATNVAGNWTTIDNAACNGNPNALLFITHNWGTNGQYLNKAVGLWYTGGKWAIYTEDQSAFPHGVVFNVFVASSGNSNAFVHTADSATNIINNWTVIDNALTNNQPNRTLFITHNWNASPVYDSVPTGVWYNGSKWAIFNQDQSAMPNGAAFNVLVADTQAVNTGIGEIENANNVYLFPNPAADNITIGYVVSETANVTVKLVAADGREMETLYAGTHTAGNYTLQRNISQLAKGIYFYVVNVNGVVSRKTLVKN